MERRIDYSKASEGFTDVILRRGELPSIYVGSVYSIGSNPGYWGYRLSKHFDGPEIEETFISEAQATAALLGRALVKSYPY